MENKKNELSQEDLAKVNGGAYDDISVDQNIACPKCGAQAHLKFFAGAFDQSKNSFLFECPSCKARTESNVEYAQWLVESIENKMNH